MKLKNFAKKYDLSEEELIYAFVDLGVFKNNGEPKSKYINNGLFSDSGDVLSISEVSEMVDERISDIKRAIDMKQIEDLKSSINSLSEQNEHLTELVSDLIDTVNSLQEKVDNIQIAPPKKERKHREIDMSTRARGLIGKKIAGWTISGDGLNVIARRGKDEIVMAGMKKKDDLLNAIDEYDE